MRLASTAVLLAGLLQCSCVTRTDCWARSSMVAQSQTFEKWQLVRVERDGSVVLSQAGSELTIAPGSRVPGSPWVIDSSYEAQTATLGHRWCTTSLVWAWSE